MGFEENHQDCDHVLGVCVVYPGVLVRCDHGRVQASCEACLDVLVEQEIALAKAEDALGEELEGLEVLATSLEGPLEGVEEGAEGAEGTLKAP